MGLLRGLALFKLGALVGMIGAAAALKRALPSRGDESSDDLALVAILDGVELKSRAGAFRGGSMLAWLGGIEVDLREAELAPGARLTANAIFGGIEILVPPHWRVESEATAIVGGVDTPATPGDDAAPGWRGGGLAGLGGT